MMRRPPRSTLFPTRRSSDLGNVHFDLGPAIVKVFQSGNSTIRSEEHTSELQSQFHLVCRLLLEKKKTPAQFHHQVCRFGLSRRSANHITAQCVQVLALAVTL